MTPMAHHYSNGTEKSNEDLPRLHKGKRLLNPTDRVSEILFGLIMALSFTCTIGIGKSGHTEIKELLIAAISCNAAWGLVDAIMYILAVLSENSRSKNIVDFVRHSSKVEKAKEYISDALPPAVALVIETEELEQVRKRIASLPESSLSFRLTAVDFKNAVVIFLLIFFSTFPIVIPFIFIHDTQLALRLSNMIAIVLMFLCGWSLAKYVGYNKWFMSFGLTLVGIVLVLITIALGG